MKRKSVQRAILEFLVIVVGVMVALAADSWRESSSERAVEARYLERLEADFSATLNHVAEVREGMEQVSAHGHAVLPYLRGKRGSEGAGGALASAYFASFGFIVTFLDATYRELSASEGLGIIRNEELRAEIVRAYVYSNRSRAFDYVTSDYLAYRNPLRATIPVETQLAIRRDCDREAPLSCNDLFKDSTAVMELRRIRGNPEIERGLNLWIQSIAIELDRLDGVEARLRSVIDAIQVELAAAS